MWAGLSTGASLAKYVTGLQCSLILTHMHNSGTRDERPPRWETTPRMRPLFQKHFISAWNVYGPWLENLLRPVMFWFWGWPSERVECVLTCWLCPQPVKPINPLHHSEQEQSWMPAKLWQNIKPKHARVSDRLLKNVKNPLTVFRQNNLLEEGKICRAFTHGFILFSLKVISVPPSPSLAGLFWSLYSELWHCCPGLLDEGNICWAFASGFLFFNLKMIIPLPPPPAFRLCRVALIFSLRHCWWQQTLMCFFLALSLWWNKVVPLGSSSDPRTQHKYSRGGSQWPQRGEGQLLPPVPTSLCWHGRWKQLYWKDPACSQLHQQRPQWKWVMLSFYFVVSVVIWEDSLACLFI